MVTLGKTIIVVGLLIFLSGCTIHFKASEVELDAERQRVKNNSSYELEKVAFLHGTAGK